MVSYDLTTSMPEYADGTRGITQEDVDELNRILWKYEINTPNRIAHFLAQCAVESQRGYGRVEQYNPPIRLLISRENMKIIIEQRILAIPRREMALYSVEQGQYILPEEQIIRRSVIIWEMSALSRMERFM